jgi:hypothetical protein
MPSEAARIAMAKSITGESKPQWCFSRSVEFRNIVCRKAVKERIIRG